MSLKAHRASWVRWRVERGELKRLEKLLEIVTAELAAEEATINGAARVENEQKLGEIQSEYFHYLDQVEVIRTARMMRNAVRYGVPVPDRNKVDGDFWERVSGTSQKYLTVKGSMMVRREIATEIDIRQKPWLNWLAIVISMIGLCFAIAAFFG